MHKNEKMTRYQLFFATPAPLTRAVVVCKIYNNSIMPQFAYSIRKEYWIHQIRYFTSICKGLTSTFSQPTT